MDRVSGVQGDVLERETGEMNTMEPQPGGFGGDTSKSAG
jgi:hypothetical protein